MSDYRVNADEMSMSQSLKALAKTIIGFDKHKFPRLTILMLLATILEGLGLILIFPLASIIFEDLPTTHPILESTLSFLNQMGLETTSERLWLFSLIYLFIIILRAGILLLRDAELIDHKNRFINNERKLLYRVLTHAPWPIISKLDRADILNTLTYDLARSGTCVHYFFSGLMQCVQIAVLMIVAALISPMLTLGFVVLGLIMAAIASFWFRQSYRLGSRETIASRSVMFETNTFLAGLKTAQVYGAESALLERFDVAINRSADIDLKFVLQQGRLRRLLEILLAIALLSVFLIGYLKLNVSAPALLAIAAVLLRLAPQLLSFIQGAQHVANAAPAFISAQKLRTEISQNSERHQYENLNTPQAADELKPTNKAPIKFEDVTVTVEDAGDEKKLLSIKKLLLPETGLVLIDGPSGAGKSTFAETLCGLREPTTGKIMIGNHSIQQNNRKLWQSQIALLPQEPFLFHGSVRENLGWPEEPVDDNTAWESLKTADAFDLVKALRNGLDENLRDGGMRLSSGERQRLCLARTFIRPAWIIVLDEPTSNLDGSSEQTIMRNLKKLADTKLVILISHNPALKSYADMTISFKDGAIDKISKRSEVSSIGKT